MKLFRKRLFLFEFLLLFLSLIIIERLLPWQFIRFTKSNLEYSVSLHQLRRQVSGENQLLRPVKESSHSSNNTVTVNSDFLSSLSLNFRPEFVYLSFTFIVSGLLISVMLCISYRKPATYARF